MSHIKASYTLNFRLWIKLWGKYKVSATDYRWYSLSDEESLIEPPPKVYFATGDYTVGGKNAPVGIGAEFAVDDGQISFNDFVEPSPQDYRLLKRVAKSKLNFTLFLNTVVSDNTTIGEQVFKYCGADGCLLVWFYGSDVPHSFYLKGGKIDSNGFVDENHPGQLYYCGLGKVPSDDGTPFFIYTGEQESWGHYWITYEQNDISSSVFDEELYLRPLGTTTIDPKEQFSWRQMCELPDTSDDSTKCDNCYSKIEDCCADEQFTSDVNEFSSLVTPDPYINSDNGEEERTTYNSNVHIAKVLRQSFKAFYALLAKISCQLENNKADNEKLERIAKALENMDNHPEIIVSPSENVYVSRVRYNVDSEE